MQIWKDAAMPSYLSYGTCLQQWYGSWGGPVDIVTYRLDDLGIVVW